MPDLSWENRHLSLDPPPLNSLSSGHPSRPSPSSRLPIIDFLLDLLDYSDNLPVLPDRPVRPAMWVYEPTLPSVEDVGRMGGGVEPSCVRESGDEGNVDLLPITFCGTRRGRPTFRRGWKSVSPKGYSAGSPYSRVGLHRKLLG